MYQLVKMHWTTNKSNFSVFNYAKPVKIDFEMN